MKDLEYSRRDFLRQNSLAGLGIIGAGTLAATQLMVGILAIDRIISRGEKPSGLFS